MVMSASARSKPQYQQMVKQIFSAVGLVVDCSESQLDAVTGLSGSGPAYVFMFIEALADGGVRCGLSREMAQILAAQTVAGAAQMVLAASPASSSSGSATNTIDEKHVAQLKDQVASPGGTTIAAIHTLENGCFRGTVMSAVYAAYQRAQEMGKINANSQTSKL